MKAFSSESMKIKVKTINSNIEEIKIKEDDKVRELKNLIQMKMKIPVGNQRLIFQGKVLNDENKIRDYKLEDGHVIHLVDQASANQIRIESNISIERDYRANGNINNERGENRYSDFFNMLLSSHNSPFPNSNSGGYFNSNDYLTSLLNNLNLNNSENGNNSELNEPIPDSFKNLQRQTCFNKVDSVEVIKQTINTIKEIFRNTESLTYNSAISNSKNLFNISNSYNNKQITFKKGQWIDVKDSLNQWLEGQIIDIRDNKAHIHYFGWNDSWNEWITLESPRLALFRTYTLQSPFSKFNSPFPNSKGETDLILTNIQDFDKFDNFDDLVSFIDTLREKLTKIIYEKESFFAKKERFNEKSVSQDELSHRSKSILMHIMQIYPLMDRVGRLFTDFANYLFHFSFNKFDEEWYKFKTNLVNMDLDESISREENLNKKVKYFQIFTKIPVMRSSGEVAEAYNLHRQRIGIIIGMPQETNNQGNLNISSLRSTLENSTNQNLTQRNNKFKNLQIKKEKFMTIENRKNDSNYIRNSIMGNFSIFIPGQVKDKESCDKQKSDMLRNSKLKTAKFIIEAKDKTNNTTKSDKLKISHTILKRSTDNDFNSKSKAIVKQTNSIKPIIKNNSKRLFVSFPDKNK